MGHRASEPIQAPDDQHIAGAHARQTGLQPWALGPAAGRGIGKDPLGAAPLLPQRLQLQRDILLRRSDPSIPHQLRGDT
jgi:hypothetical protein